MIKRLTLSDLINPHEMEEKPLPEPEELVAQLRRINDLLEVHHDFKPRQIVRHKFPVLGAQALVGVPLMFVGYLDDPFCAEEQLRGSNWFQQYRDKHFCVTFDCKLAVIVDEDWFVFVASSREYEPYPNFL